MMHRVMASAAPHAAAGWAALPGVPASVPAARRFAAEALAGCPRADDLTLAVSELATETVAWSASKGESSIFLVRVRAVTLWARIEVADDGPAEARPGPGNGMGQRIVAAVTDRHGVRFRPDGTRTSWAECTWPLP